MTIEEKVLSVKSRKIWNAVVIGFTVIVCFSGLIYYQTDFSQTLKPKYRLGKYSQYQDKNDYFGFYPAEQWSDGMYRWTGKRAVVKQKAESNFLGIKLISHPHNSNSSNGLGVSLFLNGKILDIIHFVNGGEKTMYYYCPNIQDQEIQVEFFVDRTFNPRKLGLGNDARNLGIAVRDFEFPDHMPQEFIGFYDSEKTTNISQTSSDLPPFFRWSGLNASIDLQNVINISDHSSGSPKDLDGSKNFNFSLYLRCGHPDIQKLPVTVTMLYGSQVLQKQVFQNNRWKKVSLNLKKLHTPLVLTFQTNRTWNPKRWGVSDDNRDLGVAVAIIDNR